MFYRSVVAGCGSYLPESIVTNHQLSKEIDTSDEWIVSRTGIKQRHWVTTETTSDLGTAAAQSALKSAGLSPEQIDLIVVATTTPDTIFPSVGTLVQSKIGAVNAFAFDIQAVCSGFVYALSVADNFIRTGQVKTALVIGAETMSRLLDPQDRSTRVLFGDGAGAIILHQDTTDQSRGILSTHLFSDGRCRDLLYVDNGPGSQNPGHGYLRMSGKEVYRHAVEKMGKAVLTALQKNNLTPENVDFFVPHQANVRIINGLCDHFGLPKEKAIITVGEHANTSAASIPLALSRGVEDGKIKTNSLLVIEALGGGFTWGSAIIRW